MQHRRSFSTGEQGELARVEAHLPTVQKERGEKVVNLKTIRRLWHHVQPYLCCLILFALEISSEAPDLEHTGPRADPKVTGRDPTSKTFEKDGTGRYCAHSGETSTPGTAWCIPPRAYLSIVSTGAKLSNGLLRVAKRQHSLAPSRPIAGSGRHELAIQAAGITRASGGT